MDDFYRLNPMNMISSSSENVVQVDNSTRINSSTNTCGGGFNGGPIILSDDNINMLQFQTDQGMNELIKTQIANHPRYPDLVAAYIDCQKVFSIYFCEDYIACLLFS